MNLVPVTERTTLVDPSGRVVEQVIEHRTDPLTGQVASINLVLGEKARAFVGAADLALLAELQERSAAGCPFCSAPEKGTRFPPGFAPEGQLRFGGALAMPNLFSKCALDSVVVLDVAGHVLRPSLIGAPALANGIRAAAELVRRARAADPGQVHHLAGMNFLPPAGSSVPHPHFQVHVRSVPYSGVARLLAASAEWRRRTGRDYWISLVEAEKAAGGRYLGRSGPVEWLAAYAPSHQREVWGLVPGTGSLAELDDAGAEGLAAGISRVLSFYEELGAHPFTLAFLSSPTPGRGGEYALQVRACSRPPLKNLYVNYETWFGPMYAGDDVHTEAPEAYAARLRERW
jgi:UDPglucose--hexose-1-phosphate uridylyltransferase